MNFLAHLHLSGDTPQIMVGNFIADFLRGSKKDKYEDNIKKGITLHRKIDHFTDTHDIVKVSKDRLWDNYGHYSSVIVDIYYDHFLAKNWNAFSTVSLQEFAQKAYAGLSEYEQDLPDRPQMMLPYMIQENWLVNYGTMEGMGRALASIARRASFNSKMEWAVIDLEKRFDEFEKDFLEFYPDLITLSNDFLGKNNLPLIQFPD